MSNLKHSEDCPSKEIAAAGAIALSRPPIDVNQCAYTDSQEAIPNATGKVTQASTSSIIDYVLLNSHWIQEQEINGHEMIWKVFWTVDLLEWS